MTQQILKDPYHFDFLSLAADAKKRDLERGLIARIGDVLLKMGKGFMFFGSQHQLKAGGQVLVRGPAVLSASLALPGGC